MSKVITGTGSYLPEIVITNDDLERTCVDFDRAKAGTSLDEWLMKRNGVHIRHRVRPGEGTSDMATEAARRALEDAGLDASELDLIVLSTVTSDHRLQTTASLVQKNLGVRCKFYQLEHACSGFVDAVIVANALMQAYNYRKALVVSTDAASAITDPRRFLTQSVFSDGAGAVVLQELDEPRYGILSTYAESDGSIGHWATVPAGGTKIPVTCEDEAQDSRYLQVDFKSIYPFAVDKMSLSTCETLQRAGKTLDDIDVFIPHQTGRNIIMDVVKKLGIPESKLFMCLDHTGNPSGASIPVALDEARRAGLLYDGARVMMPAVGAGMAWGGLYVVWYVRQAHVAQPAPSVMERIAA